jgi:hypothetical protein
LTVTAGAEAPPFDVTAGMRHEWNVASLTLILVHFIDRSKVKIKVKGSGQECPLHTGKVKGSGRGRPLHKPRIK